MSKPRPSPKRSDDDSQPLGVQHLQSLTANDFAKLAQQRFENAVVEKILSRYPGGAAMKSELRRRSRGVSDSWLTFDTFWNLYAARFPAYLFVRRFSKVVENMPLHRLADRFLTCQATKYLLSASEDAPAADPGLVFHWPHMKHKHSVTRDGAAMVLHRVGFAEFDEVPGLELRFRDGDQLWRLAPLGFFLEGCSRAGVFRI